MGDAPGTDERGDERAVIEALFARKPRGQKLGIDRMRLLADELGHPERAVPVVHVGGTNGKGSVAAMIAAILQHAGRRVGLFTSPHLVDVGERVQVNRQPLTNAQVVAYCAELAPVAERIAQVHGPDDQPSFFELMTAIAFLEFTRAACDIAVVEVGMGGEFDATNIVLPEVSVITSIGLDHCEWLGGTVEQIARTKAGIIKRRRPVVIGRLPRAAETVIREIASWHEAPVHSVRTEYGDELECYPQTSLEGEYQRWNAATATLAARCLPAPWKPAEEVVRAGLLAVRWPGRWQRVPLADRLLILDASHNPDGAAVLGENLRSLASGARRPVMVMGVLGSLRARALVAAACEYAGHLYLVTPNDPRALSLEALRALVPESFAGTVSAATVEELFPGPGICVAGGPGDTVVVTGSIYLLGEVMRRLELPPV